MTISGRRLAAVSLAATVTAFAATGGQAGGSNPARDRVLAWEASMIERHVGADAAQDFRANAEIIGGKTARSGRWPAQVALLYSDEPDNFLAQFCGGSLIGRSYVLTAAHCLDALKDESEVEVLTGTQSLDSGGTRHAVETYVIHPDWDPRTSDYDIGIIKLASPATGLKTNVPISKSKKRRMARPGDLATVTGWGKVKPSGNVYAADLQQVNVPFVSTATCNARKSYKGEITSRMLCAGYKKGGRDACSGDSGGPLVIKKKRRIQAGIVSWGIGCAKKNKYGVYTDVAYFKGWIKRTFNGL